MRKKILVSISAILIAALIACGAKEGTVSEDNSPTETTTPSETDNVTPTSQPENDITKAFKTNEEESTQESTDIVPWDEMAPLPIATLPIKDSDEIIDRVSSFPYIDILFPSERDSYEGGYDAMLNRKRYGVFAWVESHMRNIEGTDDSLYYEEIGDYTIYVMSKDFSDIKIKNNTENYMLVISLNVLGIDDEFISEYIIKNCDYIKEQLESASTEVSDVSSVKLDEESTDTLNIVGTYTPIRNVSHIEITVNADNSVYVVLNNFDFTSTLTPIGKNTYRIDDGTWEDVTVFKLIFSNDGLNLSVEQLGFEDWENLEGDYVKTS